MAVDLRYGMDHEHYAWSPLNQTRPLLQWPEQARVALCVIVTLEHMEWRAPDGHFQSPTLAGGYGPAPFPDVTRWSHREYGHRVGLFRLMDMLHRHGIKVTVAMDVLTAEHYPFLVQYCLERGCEIIAHGVSVSRMITSRMTESEERAYIQTSLEALTRATGVTPRGWLGPESGESARTPQLLAQAGLRYVCDWSNDEQPYRLQTPAGNLFALPMSLPLDDVNALWDRRIAIGHYVRMFKDSIDSQYQDGATNGRLLTLNLHPWLTGQPFRTRYLDEAFAYLMQQPGIWVATGTEIIDWYQQHPPTD